MPRTISTALAEHVAGEVTTLATCWKIARRDGAVLGFTDHVRDLKVESVVLRGRDHRRGSADRI